IVFLSVLAPLYRAAECPSHGNLAYHACWHLAQTATSRSSACVPTWHRAACSSALAVLAATPGPLLSIETTPSDSKVPRSLASRSGAMVATFPSASGPFPAVTTSYPFTSEECLKKGEAVSVIVHHQNAATWLILGRHCRQRSLPGPTAVPTHAHSQEPYPSLLARRWEAPYVCS